MTEDDWAHCTDSRRMLAFLRGTPAASDRKLRLFGAAVVRRVWRFLTDARSKAAVDILERLADGRVSPGEVRAAADDAWDAVSAPFEAARVGRSISAWYAARAASGLSFAYGSARDTALTAAWAAGAAAATEGLDWEDEAWDHALRAAWRESGRDPPEPEGDEWEEVRSTDAVWEMDWDSFTPFPGCAAERKEQAALLRDLFALIPFRHVGIDPAWCTPAVVALATAIYEEKRFEELPILADALEEAGCDNPEILGHLRDQGQRHCRGCWCLDLLLGKG
jgi:hypothetical protein